ncbi:MAG: XrtA-associated tyrosine autokinase [Gammaproteobacteria bacterium]
MNLIERAVERLTEAQSEASRTGAPPADAATAKTERPNTIETLADRMAESAAERAAVVFPRAAPSPLPAPPLTPVPPARTAVEPVRIHLESLRTRGMIVPGSPPTATGQEFRVIKRPLLGNAFGRLDRAPVQNGKRVMVTSAFPGEGKSFCAVNLAMSMAAERDHGIILIDADVAKPSIPRELGIEVKAGLMDWLIDDRIDLHGLVLPTNVETLSVLPAGRHHEQATELLASEAMGRLLEQLSVLYPDCIMIFDSPPLLVTTEARVLASYMGQIVMVVEAGKTPRDAVTQAIETIESNEIVGILLNKAQKVETSGYYKGYGYGAS